MSEHQPIRVGVIGLGFMGATHIAAYQAAARDGYSCKLLAVCDPKERRRKGDLSDTAGNIKTAGIESKAFDANEVKGYAVADELIADPDIDLVSVCTRTNSHVDLCIKLLNAGKNVLVEKPIALRSADVQRVADAARSAGRICMPAMCIRYWPEWAHLAKTIRDGSLGACRSLTLQRLAASPKSGWSDAKITGGALIDLHIHDADFVWWCFGNPLAVDSAGRVGPTDGVDHVTTVYRYSDGKAPTHVVAEGAWDHAASFAYRMRYVAVFDRGTLDFDLTREHPLLLCGVDKAEPVKPFEAHLSGYDRQTRAMLHAVATGDASAIPSMTEAIAVARLLEAEERSARTATTVRT